MSSMIEAIANPDMTREQAIAIGESGWWVTKGRRYRTKALAMRSRVIAVAI